MEYTELEKKELEGIEYLKENNDMEDINVVLKVYNKLLSQKVFKTKVGKEYLKVLQAKLYESSIDRRSIRPIPIIDDEFDESEEQKKNKEVVQKKPTNLPPKKVVAKQASNFNVKVETEQKSNEKKQEKDIDKYKIFFINSAILNVILMIVIAVMIYIAGSSKNPTIVDYEKKLLDKYATWQQELEEWEDSLRDREYELENKSETKEK